MEDANKQLNRKKLSMTIGKSQIVTLQVRIPKHIVEILTCRCHGKKAFLSISASAPSGMLVSVSSGRIISMPASMTLEAALALSLLIFASMMLILPMKIMDTERKMQAGLEAVGEDFSRYAYLKDAVVGGKTFAFAGADEFAKAFCDQLGAGIAEGYVQARIMEYVDTDAVGQVTMVRSEFMEDGEHFDLILDYQIQMPFPILGLQALNRTVRCRRRAWIGKEGEDKESEGAVESMDEFVYIGKNSTRYHKNRNCHYLVNRLQAVAYEKIADHRNESGGRYHACAVCAAGADAGELVYIMPQGSSYHRTESCSAILAYVRMVRLSEVEHLGACSYCGK